MVRFVCSFRGSSHAWPRSSSSASTRWLGANIRTRWDNTVITFCQHAYQVRWPRHHLLSACTGWDSPVIIIFRHTHKGRWHSRHHHHHQHHHHQSLKRESRWGTTDDFATSLLHFPLFSTAFWDLPNSRPVHPTSSSVCLVFFPLSLCLARWFWPDLMNGKHDHATAVCVSLRSSGGLRVVQLPSRSWHGLPRW